MTDQAFRYAVLALLLLHSARESDRAVARGIVVFLVFLMFVCIACFIKEMWR